MQNHNLSFSFFIFKPYTFQSSKHTYNFAYNLVINKTIIPVLTGILILSIGLAPTVWAPSVMYININDTGFADGGKITCTVADSAGTKMAVKDFQKKTKLKLKDPDTGKKISASDRPITLLLTCVNEEPRTIEFLPFTIGIDDDPKPTINLGTEFCPDPKDTAPNCR